MKVPDETRKAIKNALPIFEQWLADHKYTPETFEERLIRWYEFVHEHMREVEPLVQEVIEGADQ